MNFKKIVVTGGCGFIGSNIIKKIQYKYPDYEIVVIDNLSTGDTHNLLGVRYQLLVYDLNTMDMGFLKEIMVGANHIIHLVADPNVENSNNNPSKSHINNVIPLIRVLECIDMKSLESFIYTSSSAIYGEDREINPKTPYGIQKLIGESYCKWFSQKYNINTICLRLFNIYGDRTIKSPNSYDSVLNIFKEQHANNLPLTVTGDGTQIRDFIHINDICDLFIKLINKKPKEKFSIFDVGSGTSISIVSLARLFSNNITYIPNRIETKYSYLGPTFNDLRHYYNWNPGINLKEYIKN